MTTQQEWRKPVPGISGETKPFWDAARRGEFLIQRCDACHQYQWYPRGFCSNCWSRDIAYVRASGKGTVWTYTVTYQNRTPGFNEEVPYVLALVELEEGVKVFTNIIECNPRDVHIGMPVEVTFVPATPQVHVPMFKPVG
ncbi:MAG: Zn-ribbon domain-containing OB-fold protein [Dehalococcoidia bacterium]